MSIEEAKEAVEGLKGSLKEYNNEKVTFVNTTDLREVLAYVEELEAKVPAEPKRAFKVGDKVQEICDDTGDELPVGTVLSLSATGMHVLLENTRHAGRKLFYYDNEVEAFGEKAEPAFRIGQKVELVDGFNGHGFIVTAGFEGTVREINDDGTFEVIFSTKSGTMGMRFTEADLKAAGA